MATFLLDAEQPRWRSPTAGQPSWAHTTTRTTYPGSGSEAAPRIRYRLHLLQRSPSFAVLTAAMATPAIWRVTGSRVCSAGISLGQGAGNALSTRLEEMEDSEPQGGQGLQSSAERERFLWRIDQFEQLGFSEIEASDLAESDADLGQARHLRATGCSSTLALQILL